MPHADLDGDGVISRQDMEQVLDLLTDTTDHDDQKWEDTKKIMIDGVSCNHDSNSFVTMTMFCRYSGR